MTPALFRIAGLCFLSRMRMRFPIVVLAIALTGAGSASNAAPASFATDQRIVYSDGLHNENTAMIETKRSPLRARRYRPATARSKGPNILSRHLREGGDPEVGS